MEAGTKASLQGLRKGMFLRIHLMRMETTNRMAKARVGEKVLCGISQYLKQVIISGERIGANWVVIPGVMFPPVH